MQLAGKEEIGTCIELPQQYFCRYIIQSRATKELLEFSLGNYKYGGYFSEIKSVLWNIKDHKVICKDHSNKLKNIHYTLIEHKHSILRDRISPSSDNIPSP